MSYEVGEDEVAAAEAWLGRAFPPGLTALWARFGHGQVENSRDVVLGPFEVVEASAPGKGLTFLRAADGRGFALGADGHVVDAAGNVVDATPVDVVVARTAVTAAPARAGTLHRAMRAMAGVIHGRGAAAA